MSHTPKPWVIDDRETPLLILSGAATELLIPRIIAKVFSRCRVEGEDDVIVIDEARANACLLAAAPELLEALQFALARLEEVARERHYDYKTFDSDANDLAIDMACTAVTKATGETPRRFDCDR